ncbi:MAG: class I SAM-dependent methyltransferase [Saprospiraceae bacterium]
MISKEYLKIVNHYNSCLDRYGDTHLGVDWPKEKDVDTRYRIMLEVINSWADDQITLLDFGCGLSHLYEFILKQNSDRINYISKIKYSGLDLSEKFIQVSQNKFPLNTYYCLDILDTSIEIPIFDYVVLNGVFTEKRELTFDQMFVYFKFLIKKVFSKTRNGFAFNVMSKQVDWERDDLFHLPLDTLASFLTKDISRNFIIRNDYGLYEYTTYVYR